MYLFSELKVKDHGHFLKEWEKSLDHLPKGCKLMQSFWAKDHSHFFCVCQFDNLNNMRNYFRDHFGMHATIMHWEIDPRYMEGTTWKRSA